MNTSILSVDTIPELDFVVCHKCKSTKTKYRGTRHNAAGDKKYYLCTECGSYTTPNDGFWRMRYVGEVISAAIEIYYSGVSFHTTAALLKRLFGVKVSDVSILKWVRKYSQYGMEFSKMNRPMLSGKWAVDEKFVKVKGRKGYLWLIKDKKRGFIIAKHLSDDRKAGNAGKVLKKAKKIGTPKSINRDKYAGYQKKIAKIFPDTEDLVSKGFWHKNNNNSMESTNGEFSTRYKTMRSFGEFDSADKITDGWLIHHNFVKINIKQNKTNAERCGIKGVSKIMPWLYMIKTTAYVKLFLSARF